MLAAYLAFTLLRLALAYRHRLPEWLRYASIVVDMTLLLGLIWSFHLQYMQPPSFYLKAPTLLYVFIFIALRTLNFDARKVLTAGVVAVVGWLVLVAYVITIDPRDTMITRDYVQYLTSNSVLIGAEVDKIIVILVVTAILGYAIMRNRRLLTFAVTESASNQDLARFVPSEVADLIKTSDDGLQVGSGERREATVLFLDLEGFTGLSERLAPEDLVGTLNQFYAAVAEPLARHDGVINQFQGDAVLATFNAPRRNADHAANAVRAALDIQALLQTRTFGDGDGPARADRHQHRCRHPRPDRHARPAGVHGHRRRGEHRGAPRGAEQGLRDVDHRLRADAQCGGAGALRVRTARRGAGARPHDADADLQGGAARSPCCARSSQQPAQVFPRDRLVAVAEIVGGEEARPLLQAAQEDDLPGVILGVGDAQPTPRAAARRSRMNSSHGAPKPERSMSTMNDRSLPWTQSRMARRHDQRADPMAKAEARARRQREKQSRRCAARW